MSKGLLWSIGLTILYFIILPFPVNFIACILTGAVIPWVIDNAKSNQKDKGVDK